MESSSSLLKKPFFKKSQEFFKELFEKYHHKDVRDDQGNNLAHLSIYYESFNQLDKISHFLDVKNKKGITPRDLLIWLGIESQSSVKNQTQGISIFRTKEQIFDVLKEEELKTYFNFTFLNHLKFKNIKDLKWVLNRCENKLLDEGIKRKNQWIDSLYGNTFLNQKLSKTYIKWISPLVGYGLFAKEDIPQYSFIGEYTGLIRKRERKLDRYNDYIFGYVTASSKTPYVIDASKEGNHTRFINHSDEPNLYSTWLINKGLCHIILVSKNYIQKDMQITYDYGPTYWKVRTEPLYL